MEETEKGKTLREGNNEFQCSLKIQKKEKRFAKGKISFGAVEKVRKKKRFAEKQINFGAV